MRLRSAWMPAAVAQAPITTRKRDARHIRRMRLMPVGVAIELPTSFKGLCLGRLEPLNISSHICDCCPVAHEMTAAVAIERACGVRVGGPAARPAAPIYYRP